MFLRSKPHGRWLSALSDVDPVLRRVASGDSCDRPLPVTACDARLRFPEWSKWITPRHERSESRRKAAILQERGASCSFKLHIWCWGLLPSFLGDNCKPPPCRIGTCRRLCSDRPLISAFYICPPHHCIKPANVNGRNVHPVYPVLRYAS
jgi:hypothetical protein